MHWFQSTYTARFNRRHHLTGHLFQGRYKAVIVDPEERGYFVTLSDYIHLNPVRAGLLKQGERLADYLWSSYPSYVGLFPRRPWWLVVETVLGELGLDDRAGHRRRYSERMKARAAEQSSEAMAAELAQLRRGWCFGGRGFRERMLQWLEGASDRIRAKRNIDSVITRDHGEEGAERLLRLALECVQLELSELEQLPKGEPRKRAIGMLLRRYATVSNQRIAARLKLGHPSALNRHKLATRPGAKARQMEELLEQMENLARFQA